MSAINPASTPAALEHAVHGHAEHHEPGFLGKYVFSTDHKMIGKQFLFTTLLMLLVGGSLALCVRWQLAYPWMTMPIVGEWINPGQGGQITPEFYTMLFTMHATVMIFLVIIPVLAGAFGNFCIPLMIGADDMAFPRLNMFSYWFMWPAIACFGLSFFAGIRRWSGRGLDILSTAGCLASGGARFRLVTELLAAGCDLCRLLLDDGID